MNLSLRLIKRKLKFKGITQEVAAEHLGISRVQFNAKLNGKAYFKEEEFHKLYELLEVKK